MKKITLQSKYLKKNIVEKEKFIGGNEYLLSSVDLKLKDEDKMKWTDYKEIETLSGLINRKKKNFSKKDLTMVVKSLNTISFENKILPLINEPQKVTYKLINT